MALAFAVLPASSQTANAETEPTLRIGGTGSALGGMRLLARAFMKTHPDIRVVVLPSLGSGGGIKAAMAGKIAIAVSARPVKDEERKQGLLSWEYARTPLVFATRFDNPAGGVTADEVVAIYAGNKLSWPNGTQLRLVLRPAIEADIALIRSISAAMDKAVARALDRSELHVAINDQDNAAALEKVPGSFGVTTVAQILTEERRIKPLAFNGVVATPEALRSGTYPFAKALYLITKQTPPPMAETFVRFVNSAEGRAILSATGHVPAGTDTATNKPATRTHQ